MPAPASNPQATSTDLPAGRIDIHSHLLPGLDDGCADLDESLASVRRLMEAGFVGSICTPHICPDVYPMNTWAHIPALTMQLQQHLGRAGLDYRLWPGGELRLFDGVINYLKHNQVPTLAATQWVMTDFWTDYWPKWVDKAFDWLIKQGYRPILAHPERLGCHEQLDQHLDQLVGMGVCFQANSRCMTGEEGYYADQIVRKLLAAGRYQFMALDIHQPDSLEARLDGLRLVETEFDKNTLDRLTINAPRQLIFGLS